MNGTWTLAKWVGAEGLRGIVPALAGKLGKLHHCAARGIFFGVRFQSSLRPDPAPPAYLLLSMGPAPAGKLGKFHLCAARRFFGVRFQSSQRTRSRCRLGVHHEGCRALLVRGCGLWVCARVGSAGSVLRSQGSSEGSAFALRAGFFGVRFQSSLRTDPAPLTYFLLRIGPPLAGNVGIGGAFALAREGA